ncbi:magnesium transporter [Simkania negevensis]|uniref:Magnesium transporter MgtE n=1 Tax=Simkania negevensis TaxID=83561 RepID=A0ABS3APE5_9BACT|nr:magnesium transporter [Simkania negevensis]
MVEDSPEEPLEPLPSIISAESKTSQLDDLLHEKLVEAYNKETSKVDEHSIAKLACEYSPIDIAYAASSLPPGVRPLLYDNLSDRDAKVEFMINTDRSTRLAVLRYLDDNRIARLVSEMPTDEAVDIFEDLTDRRLRRIIALLEPVKAQKVEELLQHKRNTAGRLMTNEFFAFHMETTLGRAAAHIRDNPGIDLTRRVFVFNQQEELIGFVPARNLIVNPPHLPLRQMMQPILHTVHPDASRDEVVDVAERYKIPALPVVDPKNDKLLGVVTYEDVVEMIEDIADETITRMAGTTENVSEDLSIFKRFLLRMPWLIPTVFAGVITASIMSYFDSVVGVLLSFVIFFIPLITGMSGTVGIQCSTILVRSMAIGMLSPGLRREAIKDELFTGMLTGIFFGVVVGLVIYVLNLLELEVFQATPFAVGLIVGIGLLGACLTATLLGVFAPLLFAKLRFDPAVAAGPIVIALNDVLSMLVYLLLARLVGSALEFFSLARIT